MLNLRISLSKKEMGVVFGAITALAFIVVLIPNGRADDKVIVGFYGESLCPDCIAFCTGPLHKAFQEVSSIFTLHYVPWGNARIVDGSFECQHGAMECTINTIEACALYYQPNMTIYWPFLYCMYGHGEKQDPTIAEKCATDNNLDWDKISACYQGSLGHKLDLQMYNETASLTPAHQYTPWVTINGMHDTEAEGSRLTSQICKHYTGSPKPRACMFQ